MPSLLSREVHEKYLFDLAGALGTHRFKMVIYNCLGLFFM